jgi:SAM-dependent methyltransferase
LTSISARKSPEWNAQWSLFEDRERFLFEEWIAPARIEDLAGKHVLECGCGGGQHTAMVAPVAASVTAVDRNTTALAQERNRGLTNVVWLDDDAATMDLGRQFDVVLCVGVIHHTDDPDRTFANLYAHCAPGGLMVLWTYSSEGNALFRWVVEPSRRLLFRHLSPRALLMTSRLLTAFLYPVVHTVYRQDALRFLPYFEYFRNFRRLSFQRNLLNVFDKLNAPQTYLTSRAKCEEWFSPERFEPGSVSIRRYAGVSYSLVGVKRRA